MRVIKSESTSFISTTSRPRPPRVLLVGLQEAPTHAEQMWKGGLDAGCVAESFAKWVPQAPAHTNLAVLSPLPFLSPTQQGEHAPGNHSARLSTLQLLNWGSCDPPVHTRCTWPADWLPCPVLTGSLGLFTNRKSRKPFPPHLGLTFNPVSLFLSFCNIKCGARFSCISAFLVFWSAVSHIHFACSQLPQLPFACHLSFSPAPSVFPCICSLCPSGPLHTVISQESSWTQAVQTLFFLLLPSALPLDGRAFLAKGLP